MNNNQKEKTILICDDDDGVIDVAQIVLEGKGYNIHTLTNAADIFEVINIHKPDLILLDLWMPEASGDEITKTLKKNKDTQHIAVILFSANKDTSIIAKEAGADDFLSKPFDISELEKIVAKHLIKS